MTGQDGSYLAELLLGNGYDVHGVIRRASTFNTGRIDHIIDKLHLYHGDITDGSFIASLIIWGQFDEIYHLAAQSHVKVSFDNPVFTSDVTGTGTATILESIRISRKRDTKFYFAGSSEMFGNEPSPQNEKTRMTPVSPYGCAKVYGYHMSRAYRQGYGMFCCCGILFNHESPRRGKTFVTRKITRAASAIKNGFQDNLVLGNINACRDWGWAPDFVKAMYMMLQQEKPSDYVIATGEAHSVGEFMKKSFEFFNLDWTNYVEFNQKYMRPNEVHFLMGDAAKARSDLAWRPSVTFDKLVERMCVEAEREILRENTAHR